MTKKEFCEKVKKYKDQDGVLRVIVFAWDNRIAIIGEFFTKPDLEKYYSTFIKSGCGVSPRIWKVFAPFFSDEDYRFVFEFRSGILE